VEGPDHVVRGIADALHTDASGVTWRRVGECSGCGECCLGDDPSIKNPMFTDAERTGGTVAGHCPLLRRDGDRFRCAGYGHHAFYLNGCVSFPSRPEDMVLVPSCSYRWERA
jgi:uncharacterized cysteine cluster protein YcgN (CxxCxxCC family)